MHFPHSGRPKTPEDSQDIGFRGRGHRSIGFRAIGVQRHLDRVYNYNSLMSTINLLLEIALTPRGLRLAVWQGVQEYSCDMSSQITVFRSADGSAREDATNVQQMLMESGIAATLLDDSAPGVMAGAYEVRVEEENQARAEHLIAEYPPEAEAEPELEDPSEALDMVTVFRSVGTVAEMEAVSIQSVLEAGGIAAMIVGDSRYPIFPQEVRVPREHEAQAKQMIEDALAAGPAGAEEAEQASETC